LVCIAGDAVSFQGAGGLIMAMPVSGTIAASPPMVGNPDGSEHDWQVQLC